MIALYRKFKMNGKILCQTILTCFFLEKFTVKSGVLLRATLQYSHATLQYSHVTLQC
jgi:hypothetical protein